MSISKKRAKINIRAKNNTKQSKQTIKTYYKKWSIGSIFRKSRKNLYL